MGYGICRFMAVGVVAVSALLASAQEQRRTEGANRPRPEDTEVWEPVPPVVTPGPEVSVAPPSDAVDG